MPVSPQRRDGAARRTRLSPAVGAWQLTTVAGARASHVTVRLDGEVAAEPGRRREQLGGAGRGVVAPRQLQRVVLGIDLVGDDERGRRAGDALRVRPRDEVRAQCGLRRRRC